MAIDTILLEPREIDHQDERRILASAYNGDFKADYISALLTFQELEFPKEADFSSGGDHSARLFYILEGTARVTTKNELFTLHGPPYSPSHVSSSQKRDRLILPPHMEYQVNVSPNSTLISCLEEGNEANLYGISGRLNHAQKIRTLFRQKEAGFSAAQLKFLMPFAKDVILGGHYHQYGEAYTMLRGKCTFRMEDTNTKEREERRLMPGSFLAMPPGKAHAAKAEGRSILTGFTAEAFQGADSAVPYKNDWLLFKE